MEKKGKLELTWVDKYEDDEELEPRILVEDKEKSYGDPNTGNMLIHGNNLLALKALEKDYAGKIKCIYIAPPFNTGSRINSDGEEIGYEDGIEHSIWLTDMYRRLVCLRNLLSEDGGIFVHLDDNESDYMKIVMDEVFGRNNCMNRISVDARAPSAFSTVNPGMFKAAEYILFYAKDKSKINEKQMRVKRDPDYAYDKYIKNIDESYDKWEYCTVQEAFSNANIKKSSNPLSLIKQYNDFILNNANRIFRFTAISDTGAGQAVVDLKYKSKEFPDKIFYMPREKYDDIYILNGSQISFYSKNVIEIEGKKSASSLMTDIWTDIAWEGIANEGGVTFKKGKKPERLLKRCIEMITNPGDYVLDSFLGSGTTMAVAHKLNRKWIGIEMASHCYSHCKKRIDSVIDGEQTGISKMLNWHGGGGYKFYELAPALLVKNSKLPIFQINPEYTWDMVCEAICKIEGFTYEPKDEFCGYSSENRFIHVTKELVNAQYVMTLAKSIGVNQSLLIYCQKYQSDMRLPANIEIKKIPKDLLAKCSFIKGEEA